MLMGNLTLHTWINSGKSVQKNNAKKDTSHRGNLHTQILMRKDFCILTYFHVLDVWYNGVIRRTHYGYQEPMFDY